MVFLVTFTGCSANPLEKAKALLDQIFPNEPQFKSNRTDEHIGIDAPLIFLKPNNGSKPANFPFGDDLLNSLLQALQPINSTNAPSLTNIAQSPSELPPMSELLNNLLSALIPVLGTAVGNDVGNSTFDNFPVKKPDVDH